MSFSLSTAVDRMTIDKETGSATFDFDGMGPQIWGNFNSPISITHSAVIYTLRCLLNLEISLNEGCLMPVTIKVPKNTILNPGPGVAIVEAQSHLNESSTPFSKPSVPVQRSRAVRVVSAGEPAGGIPSQEP